MIDGLDPYPAMKDSGVKWLGQVPEHWEVRRLRNVASMRVSNVDKHVKEHEEPVYLCNYVDVYKNDYIDRRIGFMRATATPEEITRFSLEAGDVLITKDSEAWDDIGVPALVAESVDDLISGYHLALLRPLVTEVTGRFLLRVLQSKGVAWQFHVEAKGVTRYGLSHTGIKSVWLARPPMPEQSAIAQYLDHVDGRVRRLMRAKRKLITLLEEQKRSIIQNAVTRGLDPEVPLKDSGVEWLGEVPEHWEVRRNGRLFAQRNETGFPDLPVLEVSLRTGVRVRDFDNSDRKQVMSDRSKYKRALAGDIAYNMMRMWQGAVGIAPVDGLISPAYVVARPLPGTEVRYFESLFRTVEYMREVDRYSRGIVKDRNRLYWEDFKAMPSSYPPVEEQEAIADYLEEATAAIDSAIGRANNEIELFRELRTRLIADVVTGKVDVRDAAATLPEVDLSSADDGIDEPIDARTEEGLDDLGAIAEESET